MKQYDESLEKFIKEEFLGREAEIDSVTSLPSRPYQKFAESKLTNWWMPESLGGHGFSLAKSVDIVTRLSYGDAGVTMSLYIPILSGRLIEMFGTDEQKEKYLVPLIKDCGYSTLCASEREAGSELLRMSTQLSKIGGKYFLNGVKYFGTNSEFAKFLVVICASPEEEFSYRAVIVPAGQPGMRIIQRWNTIGLKGSGAYEVEFKNCEINESDILPGNGLRLLEASLNASRILIATSAIGIGKRVVDLAMQYAKTKSLKGDFLINNQVFGAKIAQMEAEIEAMTAVCNLSAAEYDQIYFSLQAKSVFNKTGVMKSAIVAKMICGQLGWNIVTVGSQVFGGLGYTNDILMGRLMNDMRYIAIVEGGDDVGRDLIFARYVKDRAEFIR